MHVNITLFLEKRQGAVITAGAFYMINSVIKHPKYFYCELFYLLIWTSPFALPWDTIHTLDSWSNAIGVQIFRVNMTNDKSVTLKVMCTFQGK